MFKSLVPSSIIPPLTSTSKSSTTVESNSSTPIDTVIAAAVPSATAISSSDTASIITEATASQVDTTFPSTLKETPAEQSQRSFPVYNEQSKNTARDTPASMAPRRAGYRAQFGRLRNEHLEAQVAQANAESATDATTSATGTPSAAIAPTNIQAAASQIDLTSANTREEVPGNQPKGLVTISTLPNTNSTSEEPEKQLLEIVVPGKPMTLMVRFTLEGQDLVEAPAPIGVHAIPTNQAPTPQTYLPFDVSIHTTTRPLKSDSGEEFIPATATPDWTARKEIIYHFYAYHYFDTLPDHSPNVSTYPSLSSTSTSTSTSVPQPPQENPENPHPPHSPTLDLINLTTADYEFLDWTNDRITTITPDSHHELAQYLEDISNALKTSDLNPANKPPTHRQGLLFKLFEYNKTQYPRYRFYMRGLDNQDLMYLEGLNRILGSRENEGEGIRGQMERITSGISDFEDGASRRDSMEMEFNAKVKRCLWEGKVEGLKDLI